MGWQRRRQRRIPIAYLSIVLTGIISQSRLARDFPSSFAFLPPRARVRMNHHCATDSSCRGKKSKKGEKKKNERNKNKIKKRNKKKTKTKKKTKRGRREKRK